MDYLVVLRKNGLAKGKEIAVLLEQAEEIKQEIHQVTRGYSMLGLNIAYPASPTLCYCRQALSGLR